MHMAKLFRGTESSKASTKNRWAATPIHARGGSAVLHLARELDDDREGAPSPSPHKEAPIYDTVAHLARGKIADISLALARGEAGFRKLVAIKRFRPDVRDAGGLKRFLNEGRLAVRFDHPNIVRTHELVQTGGTWLMVMEFLDGQPLSRIAKRAQPEGGIPFGIHLKIVADALSGLHALHELVDADGSPLEVVHRDLTSHNVFVCYRGETKLIDFGMATGKNNRPRTEDGRPRDRGAAAHNLPGPIDRQVDLFAMGTLLWQVASGPQVEREVDSDEETTIFHRETSAEVVARNLGNAARKGLLRICERALSSDPAARFASAAEMQWEVEGVLRELGTPITSGEVQEYVSNLFAEERARLKHVLTVQFAKGGSERDEEVREGAERRAKPPSAMEVARAREIVRGAPYDTMAPTSLEAVDGEEKLTREESGPVSSIRAALAGHRSFLYPLRSRLGSHAKMVRRAWLPAALIAVNGGARVPALVGQASPRTASAGQRAFAGR